MSEIQGIHVYRGTAMSDEDFFGKSDLYFVVSVPLALAGQKKPMNQMDFKSEAQQSKIP